MDDGSTVTVPFAQYQRERNELDALREYYKASMVAGKVMTAQGAESEALPAVVHRMLLATARVEMALKT